MQLGVALSYAVWAVSHSFVLFVVARIIGGVSKGNVSLSTAIVTDVTTPEKRSKGMVRITIGCMFESLFFCCTQVCFFYCGPFTDRKHFFHACMPQAMIGVAFSLGFLFGPMIGAMFSVLGRGQGEVTFAMFQYPALFSLTMAAINITITTLVFRETLPPERRVSPDTGGQDSAACLLDPQL